MFKKRKKNLPVSLELEGAVAGHRQWWNLVSKVQKEVLRFEVWQRADCPALLETVCPLRRPMLPGLCHAKFLC